MHNRMCQGVEKVQENCGKGFASSLLTAVALSAGAYFCYRTVRNLITFLAVFDTPVCEAERTSCDELDELAADECE